MIGKQGTFRQVRYPVICRTIIEKSKTGSRSPLYDHDTLGTIQRDLIIPGNRRYWRIVIGQCGNCGNWWFSIWCNEVTSGSGMLFLFIGRMQSLPFPPLRESDRLYNRTQSRDMIRGNDCFISQLNVQQNCLNRSRL